VQRPYGFAASTRANASRRFGIERMKGTVVAVSWKPLGSRFSGLNLILVSLLVNGVLLRTFQVD
jgi:hypothetical protein